MIAAGEEPLFHIKSSGIKGSIRSSLRPKYDTSSDAFINAVHHCAFGDNNGKLGSMLLIDDNTQHGTDFDNITNKMVEILAGIIDITKNNTQKTMLSNNVLDKVKSEYNARIINRKLDNQLDNIEKNALQNISDNVVGYVLYNFGETAEEKTFTVKDFKTLLEETAIEEVSKLSNVLSTITKITDLNDKINTNKKLKVPKKKIYKIGGFSEEVERTGEEKISWLNNNAEKINLGLGYEKTAKLIDDIITKTVNKIGDSSRDDKDTLTKEIKNTFDSYRYTILPIEDVKEVEEETTSNINPKFPELAYLKDGIRVRGKNAGGLEGTLVDVNQGKGNAYILYDNNKKTPTSIGLDFIVKNWEILN